MVKVKAKELWQAYVPGGRENNVKRVKEAGSNEATKIKPFLFLLSVFKD